MATDPLRVYKVLSERIDHLEKMLVALASGQTIYYKDKKLQAVKENA